MIDLSIMGILYGYLKLPEGNQNDLPDMMIQ
jgi:hypothetical protein